MTRFRSPLLMFCFVFLFLSHTNAQYVSYWTQMYSSGNTVNSVTAVTTDDNCYTYVTGTSQSNSNGLDYLTIKYDMNGTVVWTVRYNGTGNGDDIPVAIAVDASGNVYVTGRSQGSGTGYDIATIKYDNNGNMLWGGSALRFNNGGTGGSGDDVATALFVDANAQYVYVGGTSYNYLYSSDGSQHASPTNNDLIVLKYTNSSGSMAPSFPAAYDYFAENDQLAAMAVATNGTIFLAGLNTNNGSFGVEGVTFSSSGVQNMYTIYEPGIPTDLVIDGSNNIYLLSHSIGGFNNTITISSFPGGFVNQTWIQNYNLSTLFNIGNGEAAITSGKMNVYGTGLYLYANADYSLNATPNIDVLTMMLNTGTGDTVWTRRFGGSGTDKGASLAVNSAGVYVAGYTTNSNSNKDIFIEGYSASNGASLLSDTWGNPNQDDTATEVILNNSSDVIVTGYSTVDNFQNTNYITRRYVELAHIPVADAGADQSICEHDQVQIGAAQVGSDTYQWSPTTNMTTSIVSDPYVSPPSTIRYYVTVTNEQTCTKAVDSVLITVTPAPNITASASPASACPGDTIFLQGANGATYVWSPGNLTGARVSIIASNITTAIESATYTVIGTLNGCTASADVSVTLFNNPQVLTPYIGTIACVSYPLQLRPITISTAGPYSLDWLTCTGLDSCFSSAPIFTSTQTGRFSFQVVLTDGHGCKDTGMIHALILDSVAHFSETDTVCQGQSTFLSGSLGDSWQWYPSQYLDTTNGNVVMTTPATTIIYHVVTSAYGCMNDTSTLTVLVDSVQASLIAGADTFFTNQNSVSLAGLPVGGIYAGRGVSGNEFNPSIAGTGLDTLTYSITDAEGCAVSATAVVTVLLPNAIADFDVRLDRFRKIYEL